MKTQLLVELHCLSSDPGLKTFRPVLRKAMKDAGYLPCWKEIYLDEFSSKQAFITINDKKVWKEGAKEIIELTSVDFTILLHNYKGRAFPWKRALRTHLSFLSAVLVAFFPKCPFCWAAYMSLLSGLGVEVLPYKPWLLPVFISLLFLNIISLYLSRKRHGYKPMLLAFLGALLITLNRLFWDQQALVILGALLLVAASLWNTLPKRIAISLTHYFTSDIRSH